MYEIYGLIDPRTGNVRYIGCSRNLSARIRNHVTEGRPRVLAWLTSIFRSGGVPVVEVLAKTRDPYLAERLEKVWIYRSLGAGHRLLNREAEWGRRVYNGPMPSPADLRRRAVAQLRRSLRIDPDLTGEARAA